MYLQDASVNSMCLVKVVFLFWLLLCAKKEPGTPARENIFLYINIDKWEDALNILWYLMSLDLNLWSFFPYPFSLLKPQYEKQWVWEH